jgi:hypothetical protein
MLTEKYAAMSIQEQREFIGALVHLCQTDAACFTHALQMLRWAQKNGKLERVKILPDNWSETPDDEIEAP